jgi:hypothetical protein
MTAASRGIEALGRADLTICAVTFGDRPLLELNRELTERLNGLEATWRLVRNRPLQDADLTGRADMEFEVVDGAELPADLRGLNKYRSYHHALALGVASQGLATRYVLYLDPDCFVVRPGWIGAVLEHMQRERLAFFGTPYHPRSPKKIRYFPCSVFLVVDTEQVDVAGLDWTPELVEAPGEGWLGRLLRAYLQRRGEHFRLGGESSEDTGIRVYRTYRGRSRAECVQPVVLPTVLTGKLYPAKQRVLERVLPDRYCVLPKRRGSLTDRGFAAHGFRDTAALGCEEYMWQGEPFAIHLRGAPDLAGDLDAVSSVLGQFGRRAHDPVPS